MPILCSKLTYYASIILNALAYLLCLKLCRHNRRKPNTWLYYRDGHYCTALVCVYVCMYIRTYVCMYVYLYVYVCMYVPYSGKFLKAKFSKNLRESYFEKIFSKILLLSQLSRCVAIEIRINLFKNDWLFSKFSKI